MKRIYIMILFLAGLMACSKDYTADFNTEFTAPETLEGPEAVAIDVASLEPVVLSWTGSKAEDGGIVLYEVLFDKADGDFSNPVLVIKSDLGAEPKLSLTHVALNSLARKIGIKPGQTGQIKWTVKSSKGGVVKTISLTKSLSLTRGEGIEAPEKLYIKGSGAENSEGILFRNSSDGVFVIYTTFKDGDILLCDNLSENATNYSLDANDKISESDSPMSVSRSNDVIRMTVDFNTLTITKERIGRQVRCIWGATFNNIAVLEYTSNGKFVGEGDIIFIDQSRPNTMPPSWLTWTEERYYFIAKVNDADKCWGRGDNISVERPQGGEGPEFYQLHEFTWDQWEHLWKMHGDLDLKHATITIDTNADDKMIHTFTNIKSI